MHFCLCLCMRAERWRKSLLSLSLSLYFSLLLDLPPASCVSLFSLIYSPAFILSPSCNPPHSPCAPEFTPICVFLLLSVMTCEFPWLDCSIEVIQVTKTLWDYHSFLSSVCTYVCLMTQLATYKQISGPKGELLECRKNLQKRMWVHNS